LLTDDVFGIDGKVPTFDRPLCDGDRPFYFEPYDELPPLRTSLSKLSRSSNTSFTFILEF